VNDLVIRRHWILVLCLLVGAGRVGAQAPAISGVVRIDSTTREPGATVIQLTGLDGRTISAVRPAPSGEFRLRSVVAGRYRLRLLRLGYQPVEVDVQVGTADLSLGMLQGPGTPVSMTAIRVHGTSDCVAPRTSEPVTDLWSLFEVALATQLADEGTATAAQRWLLYEQQVNAQTGHVEHLQLREESGGTVSGFRPAPAAALARGGFVAADRDGFTFFLPVAGTLLSPEFLEQYCFRRGEDSSTAGDAPSLAFRPRRAAPGRTDVAGEMAFAAGGRQLAYVRFDYVNLSAALSGTRASGKVAFVNRGDRTAIGSWWVDMPVVEIERSQGPPISASSSRSVSRSVTTARKRVGAIRLSTPTCATCPPGADTSVSGITLRRAATSDDSSVVLTLRIAGVVLRSPAEGAPIPLPPGRYAVGVATAWMSAHQVEDSAVLEVADVARPTLQMFATRSRREVLRRACARTMPRGGAVGGSVVTPGGLPAPGATVVVGASGPQGEANHATTTDERGYWRICLRPNETVDRLWAIAEADRAYDSLATPTGDAAIDLVVRPHVDQRATVASPSVLKVKVRSESGAPVEGVEVKVESSARRADRRTTDARGEVVFLVTGDGDMRISARKIGSAPVTAVVRVESGRNEVGLVLLAGRPGGLDTVRVLGDRMVSSRLDQFETRARLRQPNSVLRSEQLGRYSRLSDALLRVPGVTVIDSAGVRQVRVSRTNGLASSDARAGCALRVIIDGVPQPLDASVDLGPSPTQLHGIEVYLSVSRIPLEYGGTLGPGECGLLIAWTKDGTEPSA